jgi:hypothetical protein
MLYSKRRKNFGGGRRKSNRLRMRGGMFEKLFKKKSMLDDITIVKDNISAPLIYYVLQSINAIDTPSYFTSYDIKYAIWKNKLNGLCIQLRDDYRQTKQNNKFCITVDMTQVYIDNKPSSKITEVKSFFYKHLLIYIAPKNQEEIKQLENKYKRMYLSATVNTYGNSQLDRDGPEYSHISDERKAELEREAYIDTQMQELEREYMREYTSHIIFLRNSHPNLSKYYNSISAERKSELEAKAITKLEDDYKRDYINGLFPNSDPKLSKYYNSISAERKSELEAM